MFQHLLDTYESETRKTESVWRLFEVADLDWQPDAKSRTVRAMFEHQLLSERRFFGEFLEAREVAAADVLPAQKCANTYRDRYVELALARLPFLAERPQTWWFERVQFFDVERERIWIFWRRVLHTAHHRTQLTTYLRMMGRDVPAIYGPSADQSWNGADPTNTVDAASRK